MIEAIAILVALLLNLAIGTGLHSLPHEPMRNVGGAAGPLLIVVVVSAFIYSATSGFLLLVIVIVSGWLLSPLGRVFAAKLRGFDVSAEHATNFDQMQAMMDQYHREEAATDELLRTMFPEEDNWQPPKKRP